ncbi:MAG: ABC transporter ATP-binding protein [Deinococcales bacterium]
MSGARAHADRGPPRPPELPSLLLPLTPPAMAGMMAALLNAALRVAIIPAFVTPVFDNVLGTNDLSMLPRILLTAGAVAVGGALALLAQDTLLGRAAAEVASEWRAELYRRLLRHPPGSLPGTSGGLASRILTDLREIETYYHYGLGTLVAETGTLLAIFGYLFYTNATASLMLVGLGLPTMFALRWVGRGLEGLAERSQAGTESLGRHIQEGLRHHETVRAFNAEAMMLERFRPENLRTSRAMARRSFVSSAQIPIAQVLLFAAVGLLVAILAGSVSRGVMSAGELVSYVTLVALLTTPAQLLPKGYAMLRQARAADKRLRTLASVPEAAAPEIAGGARVHGTGLELAGLQFAYGDGVPVLQEVDLHLPKRGLMAVVGESGSGKTTLLRLLLGFLVPQRGSIWLDAVPLAAIPDAELRARISYVPQGHEVLSGKLRDSLLMGRAIPEERLWEALEDVGLIDTVRALSHGLDHELSEDGAGFSGGQRQRIALARALLTRPDVLLLDEPTSSLDARSETELVRMLRSQAEERLVLAVAHRPALIEAADQVYHLRDGHLSPMEPATTEGSPRSA